MQEHVKRRLVRERNALGAGQHVAMSPDMVVSDALTHKPELDDAFAKVSVMAHKILGRMEVVLDQVEKDEMPDRRLLRDFKDLCETVQRQAKTYIEIEKHLRAQEDHLDPDIVAQNVTEALRREGYDENVANTVIRALGIRPTT